MNGPTRMGPGPIGVNGTQFVLDNRDGILGINNPVQLWQYFDGNTNQLWHQSESGEQFYIVAREDLCLSVSPKGGITLTPCGKGDPSTQASNTWTIEQNKYLCTQGGPKAGGSMTSGCISARKPYSNGADVMISPDQANWLPLVYEPMTIQESVGSGMGASNSSGGGSSGSGSGSGSTGSAGGAGTGSGSMDSDMGSMGSSGGASHGTAGSASAVHPVGTAGSATVGGAGPTGAAGKPPMSDAAAKPMSSAAGSPAPMASKPAGAAGSAAPMASKPAGADAAGSASPMASKPAAAGASSGADAGSADAKDMADASADSTGGDAPNADA